MTGERPRLSWLRSMGAVLAGYLTIGLLTMIMFPLMMFIAPDDFDIDEKRVDPPWPIIIVGLGLLWAVVGGYVTATIARGSEVPHTLGLMGLLLAMWILFVVAAPAGQSAWYQTGVQLGGVLGALAGGALRAVQVSRRA